MSKIPSLSALSLRRYNGIDERLNNFFKACMCFDLETDYTMDVFIKFAGKTEDRNKINNF